MLVYDYREEPEIQVMLRSSVTSCYSVAPGQGQSVCQSVLRVSHQKVHVGSRLLFIDEQNTWSGNGRGGLEGLRGLRQMGEEGDWVRGTEMGCKSVMGVDGWRIRYVSMSQRQQQHRAVQQAVRHVSPVSSLLLSSTTYTGEKIRRGDRER